jgi:hypothetical protein
LARDLFFLRAYIQSKRLTDKACRNNGFVLKATALSTAILALLAELFRIRMITPRFLESFWFMSALYAGGITIRASAAVSQPTQARS